MTSLGITRSFPRLYPVVGLVAFALLTLAPLALRPVRLACLIHAANVHSEPGSNPSKVCMTGPVLPAPIRLPQSKRVEESDCGRTGRGSEAEAPSPHPAAGFERPTPPLRPKTMRPKRRLTARRRLPSRVHSLRIPRPTGLSKNPPPPRPRRDRPDRRRPSRGASFRPAVAFASFPRAARVILTSSAAGSTPHPVFFRNRVLSR